MMVCLQAQYLVEKHQLVNSKGPVARNHIVSEAGPLSKGIEADSSCGRDQPGGGHLKLKRKKRREQRVKGGSDDQPA